VWYLDPATPRIDATVLARDAAEARAFAEADAARAAGADPVDAFVLLAAAHGDEAAMLACARWGARLDDDAADELDARLAARLP
jgi:hypothetical protein